MSLLARLLDAVKPARRGPVCPSCEVLMFDHPDTDVIPPIATTDKVLIDCGACGARSSWPWSAS